MDVQRRSKLGYCMSIVFKSSFVAATIFFIHAMVVGFMPMMLVNAEADLIDSAVNAARLGVFERELLKAIIFMFLIIAVQWMAKSSKGVIRSFMISKVRMFIMPKVVKKKASLEYPKYENRKICDLMKRVSEDVEKNIVSTYSDMLIIISDVIIIVSLFGMLCTYSWRSALMILIITVPLSILAVKSGKANHAVEKDNVIYERNNDKFQEIIRDREYNNERVLFGYVDEFNKRAYENNEEHRKILMRTRFKWFLKMKISSVIIAVISFGIMIALLNPLKTGVITIGLFTALITAVFKLVNKLSWELTSVLDSLAKNSEYMGELQDFMALEEEKDNRWDMGDFSFETLEFKDVYFKYPRGDRYILKGISFKISKGKHYSIIGVNGAGKTTIIKLLLGFYREYEGSILINGLEMKYIPKEKLREIYSVVFQDFTKYNISFKDNVIMGLNSEDENEKKILEMVDKLKLQTVMDKLNGGINTELGKLSKDGVELSHGQWQRVAIARAMMKESGIYILDEPCSAMDPINEQKLYEEYDNLLKGKTSISITHRLGATKISDEIIIIDGGVVKGIGNHENLMRECELYKEMFEKQRRWYEHEQR